MNMKMLTVMLILGALFACEEVPQQFKITFDPNGADGKAVEQTVDGGAAAALSSGVVLDRPGFTFAGWNTKADGSGTGYADGDEVTLTADLKLYAKWIPNAPSGVQGLQADAGNGSVTLRWENNGFDVWDRLVITCEGLDPVEFSYAEAPSEYTVTGLTNGTTYTFYVTLYNTTASSEPVSVMQTPKDDGSGTVTPEPEPEPEPEQKEFDLTAGTVSFDETAGLTLTFTANNSFSVPGNTSATVKLYAEEAGTPALTLTASVGADKLTVAADGETLKEGVYVSVEAVLSADGYAEKTLTYGTVAVSYGRVPQVTDLQAAAGDENAVLTWTAPSGTENATYTVTCADESVTAINIEGTKATVTGLQNGSTYTFTVCAVVDGETSAGATVEAALPNIPTTITRGGKTLTLVKGFDFDKEFLDAMDGNKNTNNNESEGTPITPDYSEDGYFSFRTTANPSSKDFQYPLEIGGSDSSVVYAEVKFQYITSDSSTQPAGSIGLGIGNENDQRGWKDQFLYTNATSGASLGTLYFRIGGGIVAYNLGNGGHQSEMWMRSGIDFQDSGKTCYVNGISKGTQSNGNTLIGQSTYYLYIGQETGISKENTIKIDWIAFYAVQ